MDDPAVQNLHASLDAADLSIDEATPYQHPPADTVEGDQHADEFETETAFVELLRINKVTADWEALLKCNRLYLPSAALGRIQEFTNQVIDTLTLEEKRGQFVLLLQAMGNAARAHTDHATHVPKQANSKGIIAYSDELTRLIRLEKAAWSTSAIWHTNPSNVHSCWPTLRRSTTSISAATLKSLPQLLDLPTLPAKPLSERPTNGLAVASLRRMTSNRPSSNG